MDSPLTIVQRLADGQFTITDFASVQYVLKAVAATVLDQEERIRLLENRGGPGRGDMNFPSRGE